MPWELNGNNIAGGNFLGTTNNMPLEIRSSGAIRLMINTGNPIVSVPGSNNWHHVQGNIIVGGTPGARPITPFQGDGNIRAKSISAATDPPFIPAGSRPNPGEITADRITAPVNGMDGRSNAPGWSGVFGQTNNDLGYGVFGRAVGGGWAGYFEGRVHVTGKLEKPGGGFKIDHPRDPANMYLNHSFVESSEMKNVYDGVVQLDEDGAAWVDLPEWFEALNGDFRYQLTAVGGAAPNLHVAEEISESRFKIAGGQGGMKVCWQATGSRKDAWAAANPFEVEQEKPQEERGRYLHPDVYGAPEEQSVIAARMDNGAHG